MGWTAEAVKASSVWEFWSAWNGYVQANTPKDGAKLSEAQAVDLFDWLEADMGPVVKRTMTYWYDGERVVERGVVRW